MLPSDITTSSIEKKYSSLISKCLTVKSLKLGKALHSHLIKTALFFDPFLTNGLIDAYSKCGCIESARNAFDDLPNKTTRSWNTLLSVYFKTGLFDKAYNLFDKMPQRNLVSYNSLIAGSTRHGFHRESIRVFRVMQSDSDCDCLMLDAFTLVSIVGNCGCLGNLKWLRQVHGVAVIVGTEWNMILNNALIDAYGKCGEPNLSFSVFCWMPERNVVSWTSMLVAYTRASRMDEACSVFNDMPFKNTVSWTALITGFARNGRCGEALELYRTMVDGVTPSAQTFVSVLGACADEALIGRGKQVHSQIIRSSNSYNMFDNNVYICNALIDMYCKCGDMKSAEFLFEMAPMRDVVSWNTLITGFAQNGHGKESLAVFRRMVEANVETNHVTFLGAISACSHAGLDNEGLELLDLMERKYQVKPRPDHYALLIDLLGRKNRIREAVDLIEKAPSGIRNHIAIWGAVLGACRVHGNLELARRAAEVLFELEPENTARYVMLSNIYAASGRWGDANRIRKLMEERGLKKEAACSWIELRDARHEFVAKDKFHPQISEIYEVNGKLVDHLKDGGYQPYIDSPLLPDEDDDFYFS